MSRTTTISTTATAVVATAAVGSWATDTGSAWYRRLRKPAIQPPGAVFPVVWTALYADIAVVVGQSLADADPRDRRSLQTALAANLALNAGWSLLFFRGRRPGAATLEAAALAVSSADLTRRCMALNRHRGAWLLPYVAWTSFATVLSGTIWFLNRR